MNKEPFPSLSELLNCLKQAYVEALGEKGNTAYLIACSLLKEELAKSLSQDEYGDKEKTFLDSLINLPEPSKNEYRSIISGERFVEGKSDLVMPIEDCSLLIADAFLAINPYRKEFDIAKKLQVIKSLLVAPLLDEDPKAMLAYGLASDIYDAKEKGSRGYAVAYYQSLNR